MVRASGNIGMRISAIVAASGLCEHTVGLHLRALAEAGAIELSAPTGASARWGAPGIFAAHQAIRDREATRRAARKAKITLSEQRALEADRWASSAPVRVIVPAHTAPRIGGLGPCSVFALGLAMNADAVRRAA